MADYCGAFVSPCLFASDSGRKGTLAHCALITHWNSFIEIEGGEPGSDGEVKES